MNCFVDIDLMKSTSTHQLYSIMFENYSVETIVTRSGSVVKKWLHTTKFFHRRRLHILVVGLGVQWKPHAAGHRSSAATLQLCVGRRCLIFQIMHADYFPQALVDFLQEPSYNFVGVRNSSDASMLEGYGLDVAPIDIRYVAARKCDFSLRSLSMARMAFEILGMVGVEKSLLVGRSNWDVYTLSKEQIEYAALDAFVSFELGKFLEVWQR